MTGYRAAPERDSALDDFPTLSAAEIHAVELLHDAYLIYEHDKKTWWDERWTVTSTCCHKSAIVGNRERLDTPVEDAIRGLTHNQETRCPWCGRAVTAKNKKRIRNWNGYSKYIRVLMLRTSENGETVWGQSYSTTQDLGKDPTGVVLYSPLRCYRFRPGKPEEWSADWETGGMIPEKTYWGREPSTGGSDYYVIGLDQLDHSFLKYTQAEKALPEFESTRTAYWYQARTRWRTDMIKYLFLATRYPRQVEMMRKSGMEWPLREAIYSKRKNKRLLDWDATDPRKIFGLDGGELKKYMQSRKEKKPLEIYREMKKRGLPLTMAEAVRLGEGGRGEFDQLAEKAEEYALDLGKLARYIIRQQAPGKSGGETMRVWMDYVQAAQYLERPLHRKNVIMPAALHPAHDEAVEATLGLRAARREAKEKADLAASAKKYAELEKSLNKKYGVEMDGIIIKAPHQGIEIIQEGMKLHHCVAGYEQRHRNGIVVILFMRHAEAPDEPWLTIEMAGDRLVQIHGYRNEGLYTARGRFAPDPREEHKEFLDKWLDWIQRGSPRTKDGTPTMKDRKDEVA